MKSRTRMVSQLPVDTGRSGWEAISQRHQPKVSLTENITADWLIIGAGFAGLSAARRLSQLCPGDKIVVVDACEVATGPAGRNSGFMIDVPHSLSTGEYAGSGADETLMEIRLNRHAISFAKSAAEEYGMSSLTFNPCGKINASATENGLRHNRHYADSLSKIGEKFTRYDRQQIKEITGSDYFHDGLYTPGAVIIQPAQYIRDLAAGLQNNITLYEHSPVTELTQQGNCWRAKTPHGSVSAPKVILGVNGHVEDFGFYRGRLMHIFTYASMTRAYRDNSRFRSSSGAESWALLPADPMGATLRKLTCQNGDSRIVIRTRFTYDPGKTISPKRLQAVAAEQRLSMDVRFPELKQLPFEFSWAGRLCLSRNSVPAFGEVDHNLFSACCENGLGTVKSTLSGMMVAEMATGTRSELLGKYQHQAAPKRLPPKPLAWCGINSYIHWQEHRAGAER